MNAHAGDHVLEKRDLQGRLLSDFGQGGQVRVGKGHSSIPVSLCGLAVLPDDSVLVAVTHELDGVSAEYRDTLVARFLANGELDSSLGNQGFAQPSLEAFAGNFGYATDLHVLPDGRIYIASDSAGTSVIARLKPNGQMDATFGTRGAVFFNRSPEPRTSSLGMARLAIQADGAVVAVTTVRETYAMDSPWVLQVRRFLPTGAPDTGYGEEGFVELQRGQSIGHASVRALSLRKDGRLVLGVSKAPPPDAYDTHVVQLLSNGALDPAFGEGGRVVLREAGNYSFDEVFGLHPLEDGRLVVATTAYDGIEGRLAASRYEADGRFDVTFNAGHVLNVPRTCVSTPGACTRSTPVAA